MTITSHNAVDFIGICKTYGSVRANHDLSFSVKKGTIHGLLGENGAGKSTAMKILYGLIKPDAGEIHVNGERSTFQSPLNAIKQSIGMVYQHFLLAGAMSALDNIILGNEPLKPGFLPRILQLIDHETARIKVITLMDRYGLHVPLDQPVETLSVGEQQRIEILRILYRNAKIMILDEPTAVLTPPEVTMIFTQLRKLASEGCTIIIVTHKLRELMSVTDSITIMRQGGLIGTVKTETTSTDELAALMVGRRIKWVHNNNPHLVSGTPLLTLRELKLAPEFRKSAEKSRFNLDVYPGEILGIAGVEGNGQSELIETIMMPMNYKFRKKERYTLDYKQKSIKEWSTEKIMAEGISLIPGDRHKQGLLLKSDVANNLALRWSHLNPYFIGPFLLWHKLKEHGLALLKEWQVTPQNTHLNLESFSGGNQQKILIGREVAANPKLLIATHPTRGVDVGAIEMIHQRLLDLRANGTAILLISSDLDEIRALSDRIAVLENFHINQIKPATEWDEITLGLAMSGAAGEGAK